MFAISLILLVIGYLKNNEFPYMQLVGYVFMFILSISFMTSGIDYKTGEMETYIYGDNFTSYHWDYDYSTAPANPQNYDLFHKEIEYQYSNYKNHTIAFYLAIISAVGFISVLLSTRPSMRI